MVSLMSLVVGGLMVGSVVAAEGIRSPIPQDFDTLIGVKYPNSPLEGTHPISTSAMYKLQLNGYTELVPYVMGSPNQEGAGSCLYMSITGTAEWWLAKLNPQSSKNIDGPLDLSERFLMNIAGIDEDRSPVANWKTDTIFHFNQIGYGMLNRHYRYTKGWFQDTSTGYAKAEPHAEGASYGTEYNWIDERPQSHEGRINLPQFNRRVIFADPASNQWNVAVTPANIVDQVKYYLKKFKAPVNVIYNHYGYWHAVMIVGFDDQEPSRGCSFTAGTGPYFLDQANQYTAQAENAETEAEKNRLLARAKSYQQQAQTVIDAYDRGGRCAGKGVFYVRDSLYQDPEGASYDYDLENTGEEVNIGKKVILREYEWLKVLSNHLIQIYI